MLTKALSGVPAKRAPAILQSELAEPICRSQPERLQPSWTLLARIGKPAGRNAGRSDDPHQSAPLAQWHQPGCGRLHQLIVIERAVGARNFIESLIGAAESARQCRKIGLLGDGVGANQHAIRADADRSRAMLGGGQDPAWQQVADAVEFWTVARSTCNKLVTVKFVRAKVRQDRRRRDVGEPIFRSGAPNGRSSTATDHHGWPPTQRTALPASTFPQATAKRADTCSRYNRGLCHLE